MAWISAWECSLTRLQDLVLTKLLSSKSLSVMCLPSCKVLMGDPIILRVWITTLSYRRDSLISHSVQFSHHYIIMGGLPSPALRSTASNESYPMRQK